MRIFIALSVMLLAVYCSNGQTQGGYLTFQTEANPNGLATGDFNSDGKLDLVVATPTSLSLLLNNGLGGYQPLAPVLSSTTAGAIAPRAVTAADLNGDGKVDLVVAGYKGLATLLSNGDGTFRAIQSVLPSVADVQVADLNGDGIPDLAATVLTSSPFIPTAANLLILLGNGDGTFVTQSTFNLSFTPWAASAIGDWNGDRKPDIAVAVGHGLVMFLNDGAGNFQAQTSDQPWNFAPGMVAADFDQDGRLDLAVSGQPANQTTAGQGILTILLGNGSGGFRTQPSISTMTIGQTLLSADVNGDNHPDILAGTNPPTYFAGLGDGTFAAGIPLGSLGNSGYVVLGNFSGLGLGLAGTNSNLSAAVILPHVLFPAIGLQNLSAAAFSLGPLAPGSIAAAFGTQLATQTATTSSPQLPVTLGGDSITITAADGHSSSAPLYYVSPTQVNYLIPEEIGAGVAMIDIRSEGKLVASGKIDVAAVAPQLFTLNSAGLVAANVIRVDASYRQTVLPVYSLGAAGEVVPLPVDLSSPSDSVYLSIFGTGFRNSANSVVATINGIGAMVVYAGPQGDYAGLDQVNILLPKSLSLGTPYTASIQITLNGQPSNQVKIAIQ